MKTEAIDLKEFCMEEESTRWPWMNAPFKLLINEQPWGFATNGRLAIAIRGLDCPDGSPDALEKTHKLLDGSRATIGVTTAEVIGAWCGPYEATSKSECNQCGGDGECNECDCQAVHACGICDGTGTEIIEPQRRPGIIGDQIFDRNLIAKAMRLLEGPCEVMGGMGVPNDKGKNNSLAEFRGDGWLVMVCQLADHEDKATYPKLDLA